MRSKKAWLWFYSVFAWVPLHWMICYITRSYEWNTAWQLAASFLSALTVYGAWEFLEVKPQVKFVKEHFGDQYPRNGWMVPLTIGTGGTAVCFVLCFLYLYGPLRWDSNLSTIRRHRADEPTLTEDLYPHEPGKTLRYKVTMFNPTGGNETGRLQIDYQANGVIKKQFSDSSKPTLGDYRIEGGFIKDRWATEDKWMPRLKLGATKGDQWTTSAGDKFIVDDFCEYAGRQCAIVKMTFVVKKDNKPDVEFLTVSHYARGIGPVKWEMFSRQVGNEKFNLGTQIQLEESSSVGAPDNSARDGEPLTAEHYPATATKKLLYWKAVPMPGKNNEVMYFYFLEEVDRQPGGKIVTTTRRALMEVDGELGNIPDSESHPRPGTSRVSHRRQNDNFILVKEPMQRPEDEQYDPILKLGSKPGDSWQSTEKGTTIKYTYIGQRQYREQGAAVVEAKYYIDDRMFLINTRYYVKDSGLVYGECRLPTEKTPTITWLTNNAGVPDRPDGKAVKTSVASPQASSTVPTTPPPASGRELKVHIGTAGGLEIHSVLNKSLKAVKCHATSDAVVIDFDLGSTININARSHPLVVRLFDKNGEYLTHFTTAEGFTDNQTTFDHFNSLYEQAEPMGGKEAPRRAKSALISGRPGSMWPSLPEMFVVRKTVLLAKTGNRLMYTVNVRDLRDAAIVEIGFEVDR